MEKRSEHAKLVSMMLITALFGLSAPAVPAGPATADLTGTVRSFDESPLVGAKIFAADRESGKIFPSEPTNGNGRFALKGLPAASYELGVQVDDGLFVVGTPLAVTAGEDQNLNIAIDPKKKSPSSGYTGAGPSVWNNPFTAALIVVGSAVVVGVLVENATDDEDEASGF